MEKFKILVMGLPGSGKTTFTKKFVKFYPFNIFYYNADIIRNLNNDWDFSDDGRLRQAKRMRLFADICVNKLGYHTICDFVCPTEILRKIFEPNIIIWMDTIKEGRFENTNKIFEPPSKYDYRITNYNQENAIMEKLYHRLISCR